LDILTSANSSVSAEHPDKLRRSTAGLSQQCAVSFIRLLNQSRSAAEVLMRA